MHVPTEEIERAIKALGAAHDLLVKNGTDEQRGTAAAECTIARIYLGIYLRNEFANRTEH